MGWDKQGGGGPWGSGGSGGGSGNNGGSGGGNGGGNGPRDPWGNNGNRGGGTPPDLEDLIKDGQEKIKNLIPGGGTFGGLGLIFIAVLGLWLSTGIYRVNEGEQAAILRFGKWDRTTTDTGLHYHMPSPIESEIVRKVTEVNRIDVGILFGNGRQAEQNVFMLTGDESILNVNMTIFWVIKDLDLFLFRSADPAVTTQIAAESVVREVIAQTPMEDALTKGKSEIVAKVTERLQTILDNYKIGVQIQKVALQRVDAPNQVLDAFRDVQSARADEERMVNEATGYRDSLIPVARGEAEKIVQQAVAYRDSRVSQANGDASRFNQVYDQYRKAPDVTRKRMYLETMEEIYGRANKVILDPRANNVLPHLPLNQLAKQNRTSE